MTFYQSERLGRSDFAFSGGGKVVSTIAMIGATLIGLSAMLAVSANWEGIASLLKVLLVAFATLASYIAGWYLKSASMKPRVGDAMILLGSMLYGAGIWLVCQQFQYELHFSLGVLLWALGIIPIAISARSGMVAVLSCSLMNYWLFMEQYNLINALLWCATCVPLAYFVRSPWALSKVLVGAALWLVEGPRIGVYGLAIYGLSLCLLYLSHFNKSMLKGMSKPFLYVGSIITLLALLGLSDDSLRRFILERGVQDIIVLYTLYALFVASAVLSFRNKIGMLPEWIGLLVIGFACFVLQFVTHEVSNILVSNAIMLFASIGFVVTSICRLNNQILLSITLTLLTAQISMTYFDNFFSMTDRSLCFLAGGVLLVAAAFAAERAGKAASSRTASPKIETPQLATRSI